MRTALALLAALLLALIVLHASPFWPAAFAAELPGGVRDGWLQRLLPAETRAYAVLVWGGSAFAALSIAQSLIDRIGAWRRAD